MSKCSDVINFTIGAESTISTSSLGKKNFIYLLVMIKKIAPNIDPIPSLI